MYTIYIKAAVGGVRGMRGLFVWRVGVCAVDHRKTRTFCFVWATAEPGTNSGVVGEGGGRGGEGGGRR